MYEFQLAYVSLKTMLFSENYFNDMDFGLVRHIKHDSGYAEQSDLTKTNANRFSGLCFRTGNFELTNELR